MASVRLVLLGLLLVEVDFPGCCSWPYCQGINEATEAYSCGTMSDTYNEDPLNCIEDLLESDEAEVGFKLAREGAA